MIKKQKKKIIIIIIFQFSIKNTKLKFKMSYIY